MIRGYMCLFLLSLFTLGACKQTSVDLPKEKVSYSVPVAKHDNLVNPGTAGEEVPVPGISPLLPVPEDDPVMINDGGLYVSSAGNYVRNNHSGGDDDDSHNDDDSHHHDCNDNNPCTIDNCCGPVRINGRPIGDLTSFPNACTTDYPANSMCSAGYYLCADGVLQNGSSPSSRSICEPILPPGPPLCTSSADNNCNGIPDDEETLCQPMTVFVTNETFQGNLATVAAGEPYNCGTLEGLFAADCICNYWATQQNLPGAGSYMAWLSDSTGSPVTRFTQYFGPYVLLDGTTVANGFPGLISGSLLAPINVTEYDSAPTNINGYLNVWTNTNPSGLAGSGSCNNWSTAGSLLAGTGTSNSRGPSWTAAGTEICSSTSPEIGALYCFQQGLAQQSIGTAKTLISLHIEPEAYLIPVEITLQYTAIGTYSDSSRQELTSLASWSSSNTAVATIGANTGLATGVAVGRTTIQATFGAFVSNVARLDVRPLLSYTVNYGNSTISICPLNPDGSFGSFCNIENGGSQLNSPANIVFTPQNPIPHPTYAYITNIGPGSPDFGGNTITICAVQPDGALELSCMTTNGNGTFNQPNGLTINSSNTMLYVANGGNYGTEDISLCPILLGGVLGVCTTADIAGLNNPNGIALNAANTLAYIPDYYVNDVAICRVNPDGSFGTPCTTDAAGSTLNGPIDIKINNSNTYAYISNLTGNNVSICSIMGDGSFGVCTTSSGTGTINTPGGMGLDPSNQNIYIANNSTASANYYITICPLESGGASFGTCTTSTGADTFNFPNDVIVH